MCFGQLLRGSIETLIYQCPQMSQTSNSAAQVKDQVLIYTCLPLKTRTKKELPVVNEHQRKSPGCLNVQLLEVNELSFLCIPAIDPSKGVVAAQDGVLPVGNGERLEDHGATRGHGLDLSEHATVPFHHLGVANEAGQTYVELALHGEVFDRVHVLHLWDICAPVELLRALAPLVNDRPLRAAGQDQMRLPRDL